MSTPTGENSNDLREPDEVARRARLARDLDLLEAMLARVEHEQWAPTLPRAAQLPPVPGLAPAGEPFDERNRTTLSLEPEHIVLPAAVMSDLDRSRWPLGILIAAVCLLPIAYYVTVTAWLPPSAPDPQLASVNTKAVTQPASLQRHPPIWAQDDEAESSGLNEISQPAGSARAEKLPERETVAMLQPEDRGGIRALSPQRPVRDLDPEEITLLRKQGEQFAQTGDFATARTLFQRAAEANDATAAAALGATYDPSVLAGLRVVGIDADVVKARFWYQKAVSLGSADAKRRLDLLPSQ
jgi:hypothetical protein